MVNVIGTALGGALMAILLIASIDTEVARSEREHGYPQTECLFSSNCKGE